MVCILSVWLTIVEGMCNNNGITSQKVFLLFYHRQSVDFMIARPHHLRPALRDFYELIFSFTTVFFDFFTP